MLKFYQSIVDWFVPPAIETDLESHHKSLFTIHYIFLTLLCTAGYFIYYLYLGFWQGAFALFTGVLIATLIFFQLKYKVNFVTIAHTFAFAI